LKVRAIRDNILCVDGDFGDQVTGAGIIVKSTIGKSDGITPRWFKVFEVGPDIDWISENDWVYVEYGRWTESITVQDERFDTDDNTQEVWKVDPKACLAVSSTKPHTLNISGSTVVAQKKQLV